MNTDKIIKEFKREYRCHDKMCPIAGHITDEDLMNKPIEAFLKEKLAEAYQEGWQEAQSMFRRGRWTYVI